MNGRREAIVKIAGYFINLDMPDPRTNWRQMLACVGFVVMIGVVFVAALVVLP
jgi:hypothetical protein